MSVGVPVTIYRDQSGLTEYTSEGANYIVDTTDTFLVDTNGDNIVDTGVLATLIPQTVWTEDNSI